MHLQIVLGRERGRIYPVAAGSYVLGRGSDSDIVLVSDIVSRRHARLDVDAGSVRITDVGSSNGTFINGARVLGEGYVKEGEVVLVGDVAMRLHGAIVPMLSEHGRPSMDPNVPLSANLSGALIEVPPATVLRYLAVVKKTGELIMTSPPLQGRIMFSRGHISEVLVDMRKTRDPIQALSAILRWKGMFEVGPPHDHSSTLLLGLDAVLPAVGSGARPSRLPPRR